MIENPNIYVFFDIDKKPRFIAETYWYGACAITKAAQGKLYCRELKNDKLRVPEGIHKGEIGEEQLSNEEEKHLIHYLKDEAVQHAMEIAMEPALCAEIAERYFIKADPQPRYLHISIGNGFMRMPIGDKADFSKIKAMFDDLLKIKDVKEIIEKYGVTFHES